MTLSPPLARALAAARPRLNAQVAAVRRARRGFDTAVLADAVRVRLDPLAVAVERCAPDRVAAVVEAGFGLTLTLVGQALGGERRALVDRLWAEVAVALAAPVAERPAVLATLTNAVLTLAATRGARAEEWMARMVAFAPLVDAETLAPAGQVAAWRAGMAHYRSGALAAADLLPELLALAAVGAEGSWALVREALQGNRWWSPEGVASGVRFGGFSGFGGPFDMPPEVRAGSGGFLIRAGERHGFLVADAFGATLHAATAEEFNHAIPAAANGATVASLPADGQCAVTIADSIIFASPLSHFVEVQPWRQ